MKVIILVADEMPSSCDECKFETEILNCGKPMCVATPNRRERIEDDSTKPTWCPLRPLPKKKEANHCADEEFALLDRMYRCGFNACLDEIMGETK